MSVPRFPEGSLITAAAEAPGIAIDTIAPDGTILIVTPHPDDETFGCGLAMAAAAAEDRRIAIVLLTDGEASHPGSTTYPPKDLAALRHREFQSALAILTPANDVPVLRLRLPDGKSRYQQNLLHQIIGFATEQRPKSIWSTWRGDPHCDHQTAAALSRDLAKALGIPYWAFPVWGRFGERRLPSGLFVFEAPDLLQRKSQAIAAYRSQIDPCAIDGQDNFTMPATLVSHFAAHPEIFIRE